MIRYITSLTAVFLASSLNAAAATYYVDQTAGNDSNSGTSPSAPWKNSPGMSAYSGSGTLRPGDVVNFDREDTWLVTGTQGIYLVGGVTYNGDSWGTGTRATIKANANLEAGVVRFRDDANFETVFKGFNVDANGKVATGIDMNSAFYAGPLTGKMKRVQNSVVHHVWSSVAQGQYKYGIHISNHGGTAGEVANVEILDTVVHDISRDAIALYPGDENANCRIRNVTVRGSEAYNTGTDPQYCCGAGIIVKGYVQDAIIENNYLHNTKGAAMFVNANETNHFSGVGQFNIHIRHNILTNSTPNGAILIYDGASGGDPKDLKIYGNIVYNSTANGGLLVHNGLKNTLNLVVYNNTFVNAPVVVENSGVTVTAFEFKNNIVYSTGNTPLSDAGRKITSHSNNLYYRPSGTLVSSGGTSYSSSNLTSYEPSASAVNPLFKNETSLPTGFTGTFGTTRAPNTDGLSLQAASAGVDRGTALAAGFTSSINSVGRPGGAAWDLGAYEAGGQQTAAPRPPTNVRIIGSLF
jgi:hypothetical protein